MNTYVILLFIHFYDQLSIPALPDILVLFSFMGTIFEVVHPCISINMHIYMQFLSL